MDVLQLDVSGRPQAWISPREAAVLYATDAVAWTLGDTFHVLRGGIQRASGLQSRIELHPIIAVRGAIPSRAWRQAPALSNPKLFNRDRHICAYCGGRFGFDELTREHITPVSRGGADSWMKSLTEAGCAPGVNLIEMGPPMSTSNTVGSGGGYGGFYCFAPPP